MISKIELEHIITSLIDNKNSSSEDIDRVLKGFKKSDIVASYRHYKALKNIMLLPQHEDRFLQNIKMKNVRTISGVTPVTVLTKPFPCPGKCIFCPNDIRMPKSYISSEPGAQRAEANKFDPYYQAYNRLVALFNIGHPVDKIELIILGGTWTAYPEGYRIWFVKRCFDALNDFSVTQDKTRLDPSILKMPYSTFNTKTLSRRAAKNKAQTYNQKISQILNTNETSTWQELFSAHKTNEMAKSKCVGLVIETRPDEISSKTVKEIRQLGATKVQLGVQSLNNKVLRLNKRGHTVATTAKAFKLLREAGFKIHVHYMPNLYGSTPLLDIQDYKKLFTDSRFCPDEIKIYPCSLIEGTELVAIYNKGLWKPYTDEELLFVLSECFAATPRYCRITRTIRDIPSDDIVIGNKKSNFRQIVEETLHAKKLKIVEIRSREIKNEKLKNEGTELIFNITKYKATGCDEYFLEYVTSQDKLVGFLRLSLNSKRAMIREIHVYGQSVAVGEHTKNAAQHLGLGKKLIFEAQKISKKTGFKKLYVISSVGTREYYQKRGFITEGLYQTYTL